MQVVKSYSYHRIKIAVVEYTYYTNGTNINVKINILKITIGINDTYKM